MDLSALYSPELQAFARGFPITVLHALASLALLVAGGVIYAMLTPYKDVQLVREGNTAAAISLGGALLSLAIPLSASLAASTSTLEIVIWGAAVVTAQLTISRLTDIALAGLPQRIQEGEISAAALLVAAKIAAAIVLAAAVSG